MLTAAIQRNVAAALAEDLGGTIHPDADITAQLIPENMEGTAVIIAREGGIFCGRDWAEEVFRQLGGKVSLKFMCADGDEVKAGQEVLHITGQARTILAGERTAVNFLQTLSGIASAVNCYAKAMAGTSCRLLDTRKTIPGLREASKYAVACGGGVNHRHGLYDMFMLRSIFIRTCGGIAAAAAKARALHPDIKLEIEVQNLVELEQALAAKADLILLNNFEFEDMVQAVALNHHQAKLEITGNVTLETITRFAASGVDYISVGSITKNLRALEFAIKLQLHQPAALSPQPAAAGANTALS